MRRRKRAGSASTPTTRCPEGTALNYEVLSETVKTFRSTGKLSPKWKDRIDEDYKNRK